jgi:hypothetical protein
LHAAPSPVTFITSITSITSITFITTHPPCTKA